MSKAATLFLTFLLAASSLSAKPWYKDPKAWALIAINQLAAGTEIYSASACRHKNGIGPCQGGYGEIRARNGLNLLTAGGTSALSLWGRHMGFKEWFVPAAGYAAWNTYEAVHQRLIGCPAGESYLYGTKFTCVETYPSGWDSEAQFHLRKP